MPPCVSDWDDVRVKQFFLEAGLSDSVATALVVEVQNGTELTFACTDMSQEGIVELAAACSMRRIDKERVVHLFTRVDWNVVNLA